MITAEDEEQPNHRSPDSDYYSDLLRRIDGAIDDENDEDAAAAPSTGGASSRRSKNGKNSWRKGSRMGGQRHVDSDDSGGSETESEMAAEDALAAQRAAQDEACLCPSSFAVFFARPMVKILLVAVLSGLVCGLEAANGMFTSAEVAAHFGLGPLAHSGLVTASIVGGTFGAFAGGTVADLYGRKFALVLQAMALLPTALVAAAATSLGAVVCARAAAAAVAMLSACASLSYTFELSPVHRRGAAPACWGCAAAAAWVGVRALARGGSSAMANHGWRVVGGGPHLLLALAQLVCLCRLPESPRWLASRRQHSAAREALRKLHGAARSSAAVAVIRAELHALNKDELASGVPLGVGSRDGSNTGFDARSSHGGDAGAADPLNSSSAIAAGDGSAATRPAYEAAWGDTSGCICRGVYSAAWDVRAAVVRTWLGLQRWRPVLTLLSSICTASLGAGGLQIIYWGPKVLEPCLLSPAVAETILTIAPLACASGVAWAVSDDRQVGRRPLAVLSAGLVVGGSLLLALLLVFFAQLPWHGPGYVLRWLLGVPGALGAAAAAGGWFTLVGALLPLLVCESTPAHARARALAALLTVTVIYGPWTLVAFGAAKSGNAVGANSALGGALLLYSVSAGAMLLFLTTVLLIETSGKDPEQVLQETVNRGGYVLFYATSLIRGTKLERWMGNMSYSAVGAPARGMDDDYEEGRSESSDEDEDGNLDAATPSSHENRDINNNKSGRSSSNGARRNGQWQQVLEEEEEAPSDEDNNASYEKASSRQRESSSSSTAPAASTPRPATAATPPPPAAAAATRNSVLARLEAAKAAKAAKAGKTAAGTKGTGGAAASSTTATPSPVSTPASSLSSTSYTASAASVTSTAASQSASSSPVAAVAVSSPSPAAISATDLIKIEILEEEKRAAVAEEDFGRAADIAQEIRELRGEFAPAPLSSTSTAVNTSSTPVPPVPLASSPTKPTSQFNPSSNEQLSTKSKPSAQKAAPEPAQYRAAASMFDSMMDDFD